MCDTFIALPEVTKNGSIIFGKNSDREPNEIQIIARFPRKITGKTKVQCTFISIPEVEETFEVIFSKPFHMWGAEMGVNEYGVVIGNEAIFTNEKIAKKNNGLTGMDMLRLALERSKTAYQAMENITFLLETYGQDACGGYKDKKFYYHNSFIISDNSSAWILETADIHWVAKSVKNYGSISNGLTIGADYDLISKNCISNAIEKHGVNANEVFDFTKAYTDKLMRWATNCTIRQQKSSNAIKKGFSVIDAFASLRSHNIDNFTPQKGTTKDICMHATSILNPSQTVGSMVVEILPNCKPTVWITGTSNPCLSLFKPVFFGEDYGIPQFENETYFWLEIEKVNRQCMNNYKLLNQFFIDHLASYQLRLVETVVKINEATEKEITKSKLTSAAFRFHLEKAQDFIKSNNNIKKNHFSPFFNFYWIKMKNISHEV